MPGELLLLKRIFLEFRKALIGRFCPKNSLVKDFRTRAIFEWNNWDFAEDLFWLIYRKFDSRITKNQFFCNFVKIRVFFTWFCLSEKESVKLKI